MLRIKSAWVFSLEDTSEGNRVVYTLHQERFQKDLLGYEGLVFSLGGILAYHLIGVGQGYEAGLIDCTIPN